jgi:hypothetical protein
MSMMAIGYPMIEPVSGEETQTHEDIECDLIAPMSKEGAHQRKAYQSQWPKGSLDITDSQYQSKPHSREDQPIMPALRDDPECWEKEEEHRG